MTRRLTLLLLLLGGVSCGESAPSAPPPEEPPPPDEPALPPSGPGRLAVTMASPHTDDGAILLEVRGAGIDSVRAENASWQFFSETTGGTGGTTTLRAVLAGNLATGRLVNFKVPDVSAAYSVTVIDIADRQNRIRASTGYAFAVDR